MISSGVSIIIYPLTNQIAIDLLGILSCIFGIGYMYISVALPKFLNPNSIGGVLTFLRLGYGVVAISLIFRYLYIPNYTENVIFPFLVSTVVFLYVYRSAKRLSKD